MHLFSLQFYKFVGVIEYEQKYFRNSESFRSWLEDFYDQSPGIWMLFYKKHTGKPGITYREALEEALCFGWIDSLIKRIDEDQYVRTFTPRSNTSNWSDVNKKIVNELIEKGRMTQAGLNKIDVYLKTGRVEWKIEDSKKDIELSDYIKEAFAANEPALLNFSKLASSYKNHYIGWIMSAKREETRNKRLKEAVELLKENKKLGMK